jgi:hypothetical protein
MRLLRLLAPVAAMVLVHSPSRVAGQAAPAPPPPPPIDGPNRIFQDSLVDRLSGPWRMAGQVRGRPVEYAVTATWVLNHQWLRLDLIDVVQPPSYEAVVYLGYDNASERYVAHWIDQGGGRYSETLGYGSRERDGVHLVFEYPDGPFHTTFTAHADGTWGVLMRTKNPAGAWTTFAEYTMRRR